MADSTSPKAKTAFESNQFDVIFIHANRRESFVRNDFNSAATAIKLNGYIVFDDSEDYKFSPDVKLAVDALSRLYSWNGLVSPYENEYVVRNSHIDEPKLSVFLSTSHRFLQEHVNELIGQTNKNFKTVLRR
jgi:hypothetical protein